MSDLTATFLTGDPEQGGTRLLNAVTIVVAARALVAGAVTADALRAPEGVDVETWMAAVIALVVVIGAAELDPEILDELEDAFGTAAEALASLDPPGQIIPDDA